MKTRSYIENLEIWGLVGDQLINAVDNLSEENKLKLGNALKAISQGVDPAQALDIKLGRGQSKTLLDPLRNRKLQLLLGWFATAMAEASCKCAELCVFEGDYLCPSSGLGLSIDDAASVLVDSASEPFGWSEETMRLYATRYRNLRTRTFSLQ
jgi:hypothetical protein